MKDCLFYIIIIFAGIQNICMAQTNKYCKYQTNIDLYYQDLVDNIDNKQLFTDSCTLSLLDSLKGKYLATNNNKYLDVIDKVAIYSDGYISEYLDDIVENFTIRNTENFIKYLCSNDTKMDNGIGVFFIQILSHAKTNSKFYLQVNNYLQSHKSKKCKACINKIRAAIEKS